MFTDFFLREKERDMLIFWTVWLLKIGPMGGPETSIVSYEWRLLNIPTERSSHLHCGWCLKSLHALSITCRWVVYRRFESIAIIRRNCSPNHLASHSERLEFSAAPLWQRRSVAFSSEHSFPWLIPRSLCFLGFFFFFFFAWVCHWSRLWANWIRSAHSDLIFFKSHLNMYFCVRQPG